MFQSKLLVVAGVGIVAISMTGCPGDSARAQKPMLPASAAASTKALEGTAPLKPRRPRHEAGREAFLSIYNNPDEGVAFRYPRNYTLEEGEVLEHSYFLKSQEDLDNEQPGSTLIATVLIPEDGYPNTTFEHGSLQLVTSEAQTAASCHAEAAPGAEFKRGKLTNTAGIAFSWIEQSSSAGGTGLLERHYTTFSNDACYEFLAVVAADEAPDPDGPKKAVEAGKIMRQLERIIGSVELRERRGDDSGNIDYEESASMQISRAL